MTELAVQLRHAKRNQANCLDLQQRMLTFLPKQILLIPSITHLNLSHNQIEHLPSQINQLTHLHTLNLQNNQLTDLPSQLLDLTHLATLNLKGNPLAPQYQPLMHVKQDESLWEVLSDCLIYQDNSINSTPSWLAESNNKNTVEYEPMHMRYKEKKNVSPRKQFQQRRNVLKIEEQFIEPEKQTVLGTLLLNEEQLKLGKLIINNEWSQTFEGVYCGLEVHITRPIQPSIDSKAQFESTVKVLSRYRHPHIALLIGAVPSKQIIVTEAFKASLYSVISSNRLEDQQKAKIAVQIILAFSHLHRHGILHRNISSQNIFIDHNDTVKIACFDLALHQTQQHRPVTPRIPSIYIAPELLQFQGLHTVQSDLFAVGTVLHELYSGVMPYQGLKGKQILQNYVVTGQLPQKTGLRGNISQILTQCRSAKPEERPSWGDLLGFEW